jgi:hypothetical protein
MLRQRLLAAQRQFDQVKSILTGANKARERDIPYGFESELGVYGEIDIAYWKAFDHCAAVVRCYATFERFILDSVEEWVRWCLLYQPDRVLKSDSARALYESGLAEILRRKSDTRFADVDRARLAQGLALFYSYALPANPFLPIDPFFAVQPNLRLQHVIELFRAVELGSPANWISASVPLQVLCSEEGYNLEEEIRQLVERRNEAAHGNHLPTDILGTNELLSRIDLLTLLCTSIHDFVLAQVCRAELGDDFEKKGLIGRVTHLWPAAKAFELTLARSTLYVGSRIAMIGPGSFTGSSIKTIQVEGKPTLGFSGDAGSALGIQLDFMPSGGMQMIDSGEVRGLLPLLAVVS